MKLLLFWGEVEGRRGKNNQGVLFEKVTFIPNKLYESYSDYISTVIVFENCEAFF